MKFTELKKLISSHRGEIIEALREADRCAYQYSGMKYSVAVFPDGSAEIRERLAGDDWRYMDDPAVVEFGSFCQQGFNPMWDGFNDSAEMFEALIGEASPEEREKFECWKNETIRDEKEWNEDPDGDDDEYAPDKYDSCAWIEKNLPELWDRVKESSIDWYMQYTDYDDILDNELDWWTMIDNH